MIIDGKKIALDLVSQLSERRKGINKPIHLAADLVGGDLASIHYLKQKEKVAQKIGVSFGVTKFPAAISTENLKKEIINLAGDEKNTAIIVQLPLPRQVDTTAILDCVPPGKDVDVLSEKASGAFLSGRSKILPPVVGAIEEILKRYDIDAKGKFVVIVGTGRLVGLPAAIWFSHQGAVTGVLSKAKSDAKIRQFLRQADILVAGSGQPRSITGEMLKKDVVVLDAGYEVVEGKPTGDVDFESAAVKASLITPVPGGIGPITVAMLFKNLLTLAAPQTK